MKYRLLLILLVIPFFIFSQTLNKKSFKIIPLGVEGGIDESNLSAYMVAKNGTNDFICLDAGTLHYGIQKAIEHKIFSISAENVLKRYIKAYCISHSHLDHIAGLIINSPDDTTKNIYAFKDCIETFKTHYFTWESWANFADDGQPPLLKKYHYQVLSPEIETPVSGTNMSLQAFPLSHGNLESTAFLIKSDSSYILYLGDTGADSIEKSNRLHLLWQAITPLIISKHLKAIFIEVSFPDEQPDKLLFGHLTPHWLMNEMNDLSILTGMHTLKNFNIIITHVKPPQFKIEKIKKQLTEENLLKLHLIFPQQGTQLFL